MIIENVKAKLYHPILTSFDLMRREEILKK